MAEKNLKSQSALFFTVLADEKPYIPECFCEPNII